jgi:hypothetical protein
MGTAHLSDASSTIIKKLVFDASNVLSASDLNKHAILPTVNDTAYLICLLSGGSNELAGCWPFIQVKIFKISFLFLRPSSVPTDFHWTGVS